MNMLKSYDVGPIRITKHAIDWDDPREAVRERVQTVVAEALREPVMTVATAPTVYFNPEYTVTAPPGTPLRLFVKQARRALVLWNKRCSRVLGSAQRRRVQKQMNYIDRRLMFTGILIVAGEPVHADCLKRYSQQ
jgi:hypothetical protein